MVTHEASASPADVSKREGVAGLAVRDRWRVSYTRSDPRFCTFLCSRVV